MQSLAIPLKTRVYLAYLFLALVWGTGWYGIRLCVGEGGYGVLGGSAMRYTIAALAIAAVIPFFPRAFGHVQWRRAGWLLLAGLFNAVAMGFLCWGERSVSGGLAAVLAATSPFMAAALAYLSRTERVTIQTVFGFALALSGVVIIFAERLAMSPSHLMAMLSVLTAALCFAVVNFIIKMKAKDVTPLQSSVLMFLSMSLVLWIASPCEGPALIWPPPAVPTFALLYLSIGCSAIAFPVFCYLLRHSSLLFASTLAFVHPIVALITDGLLEKDFVLTATAYIGISVVLAGVVLSMASSAMKRDASVAAPAEEPILVADDSVAPAATETDPMVALPPTPLEQRKQAA